MKKMITSFVMLGLLASGSAFAVDCSTHPGHIQCLGGSDGGTGTFNTNNGFINNSDNRSYDSRSYDSRSYDSRQIDNRQIDSRSYDSRSYDSRSYDNRNIDNSKTISRSGLASGNTGSFNGNTYVAGGGKVYEGDVQNGGNRGGIDVRGGKQIQGQAQIQGQNVSGNSTGDIIVNTGLSDDQARELQPNIITDSNNVTYEGDEAQKRNPVSSAFAAPLVTSNDTCMGSSSAGGQGITLGLSFASTWTDKDCVIRKDARFLHNAEHVVVALSLMCEKESVKRAVARAGSAEKRLACGLNADGTDPADKAVPNDDEVFEGD